MSKETILIIDDEKDLLKLLRYNLEKEGYQTLVSESGEKGIETALAMRPSLILLDIMLPQMDGLEVCRALKSNKQTQSIPIIMLTAKDSDVDHVVGLELGASDYLTKPFSVKILLARIRNILKSLLPPKEERSTLSSGPLFVDKERFLCTVKNKTISLTKMEFKSLCYFMENSEIALTRERLAENLWGQGRVVSNASINMQIKSLRKKLGAAGDQIQSVRGIGYRFVPQE